ncbi:response regulator [Bradyrhizobium diazoefficiens]|uniref:response regulator n=1 Tax=Bradyrhizobium diazoefficiens TaxID=1355477 RepID=UPI00190A2E73|nr:response regulator [Bradyrhizobium diazoefficiens]QQO15501.1 response regulator [Bradyrhizobium diazoefficiens]
MHHALAETKPERSLAPSEFAHSGRKVLVVEDNDDLAELAIEMMTTLGFVVERAANAREALAKLAAKGRNVGLVFSDVVMPGGMLLPRSP